MIQSLLDNFPLYAEKAVTRDGKRSRLRQYPKTTQRNFLASASKREPGRGDCRSLHLGGGKTGARCAQVLAHIACRGGITARKGAVIASSALLPLEFSGVINFMLRWCCAFAYAPACSTTCMILNRCRNSTRPGTCSTDNNTIY